MTQAKAVAYQDALRWTGSTDQLYSVRRTQISEGPGDGIRLIEANASGLSAIFTESRALDLYALSYRGINLGFLSKNNLMQGRVLPVKGQFTPTWPAGFMATCGLRNAGPDCQCGDEYHPLHGQIAGMAAEQVTALIRPETDQILISGHMRESSLFGHHLVMRRQVTLSLSSPSIRWQDTVINLAAEPEPVFLLYHINFGYPFLDPQLQLHFPPGQVIPRTAEAEKGLSTYDQIIEPVDGYAEQVFFHQSLPGSGDQAELRLVRADLRLSVALRWSWQDFPWLIQWKSMKSGDYALGLEPSTSLIRGRAEELAKGYALNLAPMEQKTFAMELALTDLP